MLQILSLIYLRISMTITLSLQTNFAKIQNTYIYVTVRAKTNLVHTSKFATSVLYNFDWERSTELKFEMLVH